MISWIRLQNMLGYGETYSLSALIEEFGSPDAVLSASDGELSLFGVTNAQLRRRNSMTPEKAQEIILKCEKDGVKIVPYLSEYYPYKLERTETPPVVLYAIGNLNCLNNNVSVAVIGTRKITDYGKRAAFSLAARLALGNSVIVSGGAKGGDSFAHLGALSVSGKTINVTAGGVSSGYLKTNKKLREDIVKFGGVLVSEFLPDYIPRGKYSFAVRNRLISGLSDALVVVEAPQKSGTLLTASSALEQGRDVYAMPGAPDLPQYEGTNRLIYEGARPIISPEEILLDYIAEYNNIDIEGVKRISAEGLLEIYHRCISEEDPKEKQKKDNFKKKQDNKAKKLVEEREKKDEKVIASLSEEALKVYESIGEGETPFDDIVEKSGFKTTIVLKALTKLEIKGLITALPGSRYRLK